MSSSSCLCERPVRAYVEDIEGVVLNSLRANLADAHLMDVYIDAYVAERKRLARQAVNEHDAIGKRLAGVERKLERLKKAYMADAIDLAEFKADKLPLQNEKLMLGAKLALVEGPASAISFHPAAVTNFKNALRDLSGVLCADGELPSAKLIRSVVDRVIVTPAIEKPKSPFERRAMRVEIIGGLDALLSGPIGGATAPLVRGCGGSGGGT